MSERNTPPRTRKKKRAGRKAPGLLSFVVVRQFFMVLAAPGTATALAPVFDMQDSFFIMVVAVAIPSLAHGQFWKWSYDWYGRGEGPLRNTRIAQVALGAVHVGLVGWALVRIATGEMPWDQSSFYYGLAIAGGAAGLWETIRPALEIANPPEAALEAERKKKAEAKAAAAPSPSPEPPAPTADGHADASTASDGTTPEDDADAPTPTDAKTVDTDDDAPTPAGARTVDSDDEDAPTATDARTVNSDDEDAPTPTNDASDDWDKKALD